MHQWEQALVELTTLVGSTLENIVTRRYKQRFTPPGLPLALQILDEMGVEYILIWSKDTEKLNLNPFYRYHLLPEVLNRPLSYNGYSESTFRAYGSYKKLNTGYFAFLKSLAEGYGYSLVVELDLPKETLNEIFRNRRFPNPSQPRSKHTVIPITIDTPKEYEQLGLAPLKAPKLEHKSQGVFAELPESASKALWRMARTGDNISATDQIKLLTLFLTNYSEKELDSHFFDAIT